MNYFNYVISLEAWKIQMIQDTIDDLKGYAKTIYKSLWQDALDASFFHIVRHFNFSIPLEDNEDLQDKLCRYSTRVVGTILLGKYNHEIEHEVSLLQGMDRESIVAESTMNPLSLLVQEEDVKQSQDLEKCIEYLVPYFVQDYTFFKTRRADKRKLKYDGLFSKFSAETITETMSILTSECSSTMEELYSLVSKSKYRLFPEDRYLKSMDTATQYMGYIHGTLLYSSNKARSNKSFYLFNVKEIIADIIREYYSDETSELSGKFIVKSLPVYVSLSGAISTSEEGLRKCLECELVGALLARVSRLKVVVYEMGNYMILSSPRDSECGLTYNILNTNYLACLKRLVSKRIERGVTYC